MVFVQKLHKVFFWVFENLRVVHIAFLHFLDKLIYMNIVDWESVLESFK